MENPVMDLDEHMPENKQEERLKKLEWLTGLDEQNRAYYRYDQEDEDKDNYLNNISCPECRDIEGCVDAVTFEQFLQQRRG